jgi:carnosine N-methyltransferase
MRDIARMERDFTKIDPKYLKMLSFNYKKDRIDRLKKAVIQNSTILNKIVAEYQNLFEFDKLPNGLISFKPMYVKPSDVVKMRSTIKSFLRDWSSEVSVNYMSFFIKGKQERLMCYQPLMDEVHSYFPNPVNPETGERISILHPGCGMGRLVFDFALEGYKS